MRRLALLVIATGCNGAMLSPPSPPYSLRQLRFSPNGRYVLAQDDLQVTILAVEPFAILFRIPAEDATEAQFTPD